MAIDWLSHIAFETPDGVRHPAKRDFDPDEPDEGKMCVLVFGERFKPLFSTNWRSLVWVDEKTGISTSSANPGKIVNVEKSMLDGIDLSTGQPRKYTLEEAAAILGVADPGDPITEVIVTVKRKSGAKDVLGGVSV